LRRGCDPDSHAFVHRCLFAENAGEIAQAFEMLLGDGGDESYVGLGNVAQNGDFPGKARSDLDDSYVRTRRQREQREGHADPVIEIPRRRVDRIRAAERGFQKILGARLTVASRNADDRFPPGAPPVISERAQCNESVADFIDGNAERTESGRSRSDYRRRAVSNRIPKIVMAIEALTLEGQEHIALADLPRIGGDSAHLSRAARRRARRVSLERGRNPVKRPEPSAHA